MCDSDRANVEFWDRLQMLIDHAQSKTATSTSVGDKTAMHSPR